MHGVHDRAGIKKEQRLKQAVVPNVQQRAAEAQQDKVGPLKRAANHCQPDPHGNDTDVFNTAVGHQALDVVLTQGKKNTEHPGNRPQPQQHLPAPEFGDRQQGQQANDSIDAHFEHDARHNGGHMARGVGMCPRKPNVQRHQPGLETKTHHRKHKKRRGHGRSQLTGKDRAQRKAASDLMQQGKQRQQADGTGMGGNQIDPSGAAHFGLFIFGTGEEERRRGHEFPGDQEED